MEKMIVTEYGRPIMLNKVKEFAQRTMFLAEDKVIPYAVFALLDSGEMVNIGNFNDADRRNHPNHSGHFRRGQESGVRCQS